jgi:hypothetical protein
MIKKILIIAGISLIVSCSQNHNKFEVPVTGRIEEVLRLEDSVSLEQKPGSYISKHIMEFIKVGNTFLINETGNAIKAFDNRGRFLFEIGRAGSGPGEYMSDLKSIYPIDSTRFLISNYDGRMLFYNTNGVFLGEKRFSKYTTFGKTLLFTGGHYFLHVPVSENGNHVIKLDTLFNIEKEYLKIEQKYIPYFNHNLLYGSIHMSKDGKLFEINSFSEQMLNIIDINTLKEEPWFLNCGNKIKYFPANSNLPGRDVMEGTMLENVSFIGDDYLLIDFKEKEKGEDGSYGSYPKDFFTLFFDLKKKTSYLINSFSLSRGVKFSDQTFIYTLNTPISDHGTDSEFKIYKYAIIKH